MLQGTKNLDKIELELQIFEKFRSYYTNFFVSILKRLPQLSAFGFHVTDHRINKKENQLSEGLDLSQLLCAASEISNLEQLEISMPNLLFDDNTAKPCLRSMKEFNIGVSGSEDEEPVRFENISKWVTGTLKTLIRSAPELTCLILDFRETIDEQTFLKRFTLIEQFRNLEFLCISLTVEQCSQETVRNVGRAIQSLKKLSTLVLKFYGSDKNIFDVKTYMKRRPTTRDIFISVDELAWVGDEFNLSVSDPEEINM